MATVTKPAMQLRTELTKAGRNTVPVQHTFWFDGDASTTDFALAAGWKPTNVFVGGALMRPGASDDYEIAFDGFIYTVSFSVAPAATDIGIIAERQV